MCAARPEGAGNPAAKTAVRRQACRDQPEGFDHRRLVAPRCVADMDLRLVPPLDEHHVMTAIRMREDSPMHAVRLEMGGELDNLTRKSVRTGGNVTEAGPAMSVA